MVMLWFLVEGWDVGKLEPPKTCLGVMQNLKRNTSNSVRVFINFGV